MHHAAAEGASQNLHVTGHRPLIRHYVVVLDITDGGEAVEATHNKEQITDHFDAEGQFTPGVGEGIVDLGAAQTIPAIEAADL